MNYLFVVGSVIANIIVCESDAAAKELGALPFYEGANIGDEYAPPDPVEEPTVEDRIAMLEAKNSALTQSNQFLEECLVEMAAIVYA